MAIIYAIPTTATGFTTITSANTESNPVSSSAITPSDDQRMYKVQVEANIDTRYQVQYSYTGIAPWINYMTAQTCNDESVVTYVSLFLDKYTRVILWNNGSETGQIKVVIDTDPLIAYVTIEEVRDQLKTQDSEYSDTEVTQMIVKATQDIDTRTGRTWQKETTVTDEYITPGDSKEVQLENVDVQSITAFSVDEVGDGTYTSVTTSTLKWNEEGSVQLTSTSEVGSYPENVIKGVKVSYMFGSGTPTEEVKQLCLDMVKNIMMQDEDMKNQITGDINKLKANKYLMI